MSSLWFWTFVAAALFAPVTWKWRKFFHKLDAAANGHRGRLRALRIDPALAPALTPPSPGNPDRSHRLPRPGRCKRTGRVTGQVRPSRQGSSGARHPGGVRRRDVWAVSYRARHAVHSVRRRGKAAGIRDARVQDARHTVATLLLAQGIEQRVVMEILGHSQFCMMSKYAYQMGGRQGLEP
jgi:integrase